MRALKAISLCALLGACAFSRDVQRFGVEYNAALAGMTNEQTLLNILRAKDGMPTHFTSVSAFRGNINLTAGASINGQLRGQGLTETLVSGFTNTMQTTATTTTNVASPGAPPSTSTVASTVTTPVTNGSATSALAEGVDLFTPQLSGQIVSGSTIDVQVFDTQKFYQGITSSIPFPTIETLLNRGMDNRLVMALMVARIDFRIDEAVPGFTRGETFRTVFNDPSDPTNPVRRAEFQRFLNCFELGSGTIPAATANVAPISRFTRAADGSSIPLDLETVTQIDGERFGVSGAGIGIDPANDNTIFLTRLTGARRAARLSQRSVQLCRFPGDMLRSVDLGHGPVDVAVPRRPQAEPFYIGEGRALVYSGGHLVTVRVAMDITFRSPEGLFTYIGAYLAQPPADQVKIDGQPLFSIATRRVPNAFVNVRYRGGDYSLVNDPATGTRNAQVFTLLQQLINLHKDAAERPTAIPVRAIPF
jgi:hypothetical protein